MATAINITTNLQDDQTVPQLNYNGAIKATAILLNGGSTGINTISAANIGPTNYTNVIPAKSGTFAMLSDIATLSGYLTLDQTTPQTVINGQPVWDTLTASQLLATDSNKKFQSLDISIYPSLLELSYGKGVTSAIQSQLNSKPTTEQVIAYSIVL